MTTLASTPVAASTASSRRRSGRRRVVWLIVLIAVVAVVCVMSVTFGNRTVSLPDIVAGLTGDIESNNAAAVARRVPRTILALLVGAALAVSGAVMQGVTRNPLADPQILGINGGASLAVVTGLAFFGVTSAVGYIWLAMLGAALAALFVYTIGSLGRGGASPLKLALAGAATAVAVSSLISAILLPRIDVMSVFRFWQIGGVGGATVDNILLVIPFIVVGFVICLASSGALNALALGDELATGLGEKVRTARLFSALGAVILCGAATAVAGPIGFVGLIVPHICRLIVGPDHRWLLPVSALVGGGLLTIADVVGRVIARPQEVEVGVVTALIGAPFFIAIVRRQRMRAL
ncbi:iron ABC transporter permease [Microbacterium sp. EYE_5]|uniref:FecCD family ABC transporter permease n=1 Tax=unclassified Microbacterium TaxID=2609290 RepID=UPI002002B234|nr:MULTISPECIES: iron ABC transporter permease [unclassified Microbacterium]MCK6080515.1 iron ABC transporter permease [Microbacterium sp. EYE_382]MCK6085786.1 iron ABC transporter permease [Microbacterium sp. EYE_384]MCK6124716.1 iron ABC transporter permease [Microbacterium sp. EYE_80]MCK6127625.1 iron ABC transporter permease [Microbacterium sp. EYE_79]MCK6141470.1 iron ABC transporter permease [Microbacterium sp. EYE_39]